MDRRILAPALAMALLMGCAPAPAPQVSPPEEEPGGIQVRTHWSALESREGAQPDVERRWYGERVEELIPRDDYGPLAPYAGALLSAPEMDGGAFWDDYLLYGLMTRDGLVVTDPVYNQVEAPAYWDRETEAEVILPLLVLKRSVGEGGWPSGDGTLLAVAARDGSWCTEARWWTYGAGAAGVLLYGPEGCDLLDADGAFRGNWTWDQLTVSQEMTDEVIHWERLTFEPSWVGDLVWMGWTDQSRSRVRVLDLTAGTARPERDGEWAAAREDYYCAWLGDDNYFRGIDTFDGTYTRLELGDRICEIPYGGRDFSCVVQRGLALFYQDNWQARDRAAAVYRLDGSLVVGAGTYDAISLAADSLDAEGPALLVGERPDGLVDLMDETGAILLAGQTDWAVLKGGVLQAVEGAAHSGAKQVVCRSVDDGRVLFRRTLGLGDDQREPWKESDW